MGASPIPATGTGWDVTIPDSKQPHGNDYIEHRETKLAVATRLAKEHVAFGAAGAGGEHKSGSAMMYIGNFSTTVPGDTLPTKSLGGDWYTTGTALGASDYGRMAYDATATLGGKFYVYTSAGWVELGMAMAQAQTIAGVKTFLSVPVSSAATITTGDSTTKIPTTAFVQQEIAAITTGTLPSSNDAIGEYKIVGLEIKWGSLTCTKAADTTVNFVAQGLSSFTNYCFQAYAIFGKTTSGSDDFVSTHTIAKDSFLIRMKAGDDCTIRWFAIGK
jgi:hypothetical protein